MATGTRPTPSAARAARRWPLRAALTLALAGCAHRPCSSADRSLRGVWDDAVRAPLVAALNEVPAEPAVRSAAVSDLDLLARAWTDARTSTCTSEQPRASQHLHATCQDLARDVLAALAARLAHATAADLDRLAAAALAARRLLTACERPAVAFVLSDPAARELVAPALALAFADPTAAAQAAHAEQNLRAGPSGHADTTMSSRTLPLLADLARLLRGWSVLDERPDEAAVLADLPPGSPLHPFARELRAATRPATDPAALADLQSARDGCVAALGDHPRCAVIDVERARRARAAGDDATAARLLARAHARFAAEEPDSDATTDVALQLGDLARVRGDLDAALEHHRAVLEHRRRRRGERHLATAEALHAVGADLEALRRLDEAVIYYTRAAVIRQDRAPDDPVTARTYNNLGRLSYLLGAYDDARRFHLAALQIRRAALGDDHPDTATSYNNLGAVDLAEGDADAALADFTRAREIRERTLGLDHPYLAVSLHNLAEVHALRGDLTAAEPLYLRALEIRRARFGDDHPETARTRYALGGLALRRGDRAAAVRELSAALSAFTATLGLDHPETRRALARLREAQAAPQDLSPEPGQP